jgi:hypothetical protein
MVTRDLRPLDLMRASSSEQPLDDSWRPNLIAGEQTYLTDWSGSRGRSAHEKPIYTETSSPPTAVTFGPRRRRRRLPSVRNQLSLELQARPSVSAMVERQAGLRWPHFASCVLHARRARGGWLPSMLPP